MRVWGWEGNGLKFYFRIYRNKSSLSHYKSGLRKVVVYLYLAGDLTKNVTLRFEKNGFRIRLNFFQVDEKELK